LSIWLGANTVWKAFGAAHANVSDVAVPQRCRKN
jgi:hypothetical protein